MGLKYGSENKDPIMSNPSVKKTMAELADKHDLYEQSVQDTEFEYDFVNTSYQRIRHKKAKLIREDFCGTAKMCCEWVSHRPENRAIGVDLESSVLNWGREHNLSQINEEQRSRIELIQGNVLNVDTPPVDIVLAMNFSYFIFKDRQTMKGYFKGVYDSLAADGVMFLDAFGGYEAYREMEELTEEEDFDYVWDQDYYNPITGDIRCYIHFDFPDGSRIEKAFSYEWRLWSLPEIKELLLEAGFAEVTIYWEGSDDEGEGDGNFTPTTQGEADQSWICYISAQK